MAAVKHYKCARCGELKSSNAFNRDSRTANRRKSQCRVCQRNYNETFRRRKPLYNIWNLMMQRCYNEGSPAYRHYGGRGIKVCTWWHDYKVFAADMSPRPSPKHSIDRMDNDGDYCPENCRWATHQEQVLNLRTNRLIAVDGVVHPMAEWARINRIPMPTIEARIYRYGWNEVDAITIPARPYRQRRRNSA